MDGVCALCRGDAGSGETPDRLQPASDAELPVDTQESV